MLRSVVSALLYLEWMSDLGAGGEGLLRSTASTAVTTTLYQPLGAPGWPLVFTSNVPCSLMTPLGSDGDVLPFSLSGTKTMPPDDRALPSTSALPLTGVRLCPQ